MLPQGMLAYQSPLHLQLVVQKHSLSILIIGQNIGGFFVGELIGFSKKLLENTPGGYHE
jgi:hypothetical protein